MIDSNTIRAIVELATRCYSRNESPDAFSVQAAHLASVQAASKRHPGAAQASAFVALGSLVNTLQFASEISLNAAVQTRLKREYFPTAFSSFGIESVSEFTRAAEPLKTLNFRLETFSIYKHHYMTGEDSEACKQALIEAASIWLPVYASARIAYLEAFVIGNYRDSVSAFQETFTKRLNQDLAGHYIEPGFLMNVLENTHISYLAVAMIALGLVALSIGVVGFLIPISIAAISITSGIAISISSAGAASTGLGGALLSGGVFARKSHVNQERHCQAMADDLNRFEMKAC